MLNRALPLLTVSAIAALATPANAQTCDAEAAPMVSFADATNSVALDSCVRIEGVAVGRVLVEDERTRYRLEQRRNDPSSTGAVLGLYGDERPDEPTRVRLVGRVSDCATLEARSRAQAEPNSIIMMSGYCHYFAGRVIIAESIEQIGPANFVRQLGGEGSAGLGNLSRLVDGDVRRQMMMAAQRFAAALRNGDRATLAEMHGGGPSGTRRGSDDANALLLDRADSPFAPLRNAAPVAIEIFGWRPPLWANAEWHAERARTGTAEAIACFSARADAANLWPIDSKDADNRPERPYACTRIVLSGTGADAPASFDTEQAAAGVAEPG